MSPYLVTAASAALLVVLGRLPFLRLLRLLALPFVCLALAAAGLGLVEALHLEGTTWASAADVAFLVVLGYLAGRVLVLLVFDWVLGRRLGLVVPHLVRDLVSLVVNLALIATVLKTVLGLEVGALFATSAVITVIVGLSLQQTIGNLLAGLAVVWEGRLKAGEWVRVGDVVGEVVAPGWRSVVLRTTLHELVVIPNSKMTEERVTLLGDGTRPVGVEITLSASYDAPPDRVHRVLLEAVRDVPGVEVAPAPMVLTQDLADNGIVYAVRVWSRHAFSDTRLRSEVLSRAYSALGRAGIEIPFPQRTVHAAPRRPAVDQVAAVCGALEACELFAGLPADTLVSLARASRRLRFAPGEAVVREGDSSTAMYAIAAGTAVVTQVRGGAATELLRCGPGQAFGEVAFLTGTARLATVTATSALEVVEIGEDGLRQVLAQLPELAEQLADRVAAHQRDASDAAEAEAARTGRSSVAGLLGAILRRFGRSG